MRPPHSDSEGGFSLVELLITIVIVSVTFTVMLGGLTTTISVSDLHRKQATADAVARSAAEWVKDSIANRYFPCATSGSYSFSGLAVPSGYAVQIPQDGVENWTPPQPPAIPSSYSPQFQASQPGCVDSGLQRIKIVVTSSDLQASVTVQVLKRDVR